MFFAGYVLFQLPSNLAIERFGARRWISLLMVLWGLISSSMIFVGTPKGFYFLRFLLGSAEAGFFPGMILYLKSWFPASARARAVALFMAAGPLSGVVGGPISGALLRLHHLGGLSGWQWLFLLEGVPAILLGIIVPFYLADFPRNATWLNTAQRDWLISTLRDEIVSSTSVADTHPFSIFENFNILFLILIYFGVNTCTYGISLWLPSVLQSLSTHNTFMIGVISVIPYLAAAVAMVLVGAHSDRTGERRAHTAIPAFLGAAALLAAAYSSSLVGVLIALSVAMLSASSMVGPFWAIPTTLFQGLSAAVAIAAINSLGNLGGFFGSYEIGYLRNATGTFRAGFLLASATLALCGCLVPLLRARRPSPPRTTP